MAGEMARAGAEALGEPGSAASLRDARRGEGAKGVSDFRFGCNPPETNWPRKVVLHALLNPRAPAQAQTVLVNQASGAMSAFGEIAIRGDARGAMYGALDFAEQLEIAGAPQAEEVRPTLGLRALNFNMPLPGTADLSEEDWPTTSGSGTLSLSAF